jgi:hypothetical protein
MIRHQFNRRAVGADDVHIKVHSFALSFSGVLGVVLHFFLSVRVKDFE